MPAETPYPLPKGCHLISPDQLDSRSDAEIDSILCSPAPPDVSHVKNVWFFWHSGYNGLHGYTKRNIRAWYKRFASKGWQIRVLDRLEGSSGNVDKYLDVRDPQTFPGAFCDGRIGGTYGLQHTSDLVRFPLLLKYGGVYADVGLLQIADIDEMWNRTIGNPASPYELLTFNCGDVNVRNFANHFLCAKAKNPFIDHCHKLFLALWNEDGGKTTTEGMHASALLKPLPLNDMSQPFVDNGRTYSAEESSKLLTDYIIQGHAIMMVAQLEDPDDGWNGPEYVSEHVYAMEFMVASQLINQHTAWDGRRAFELMSLKMPSSEESETDNQRQARIIVEDCLSRSFSFKLAHGLIVKVLGPTLGSLWRERPDSDIQPGTYAAWLRYGIEHFCPNAVPKPLPFTVLPPVKRGGLLQPI